MKVKAELDPVWEAVLIRLEREGFKASDVLESMLRAAVTGLSERIGATEVAALTVSALRDLPQHARVAA